MNFKRLFETQESRDKRITTELLRNAFNSVEYLMQVSPLSNSWTSPVEKARCRLNLYSMNSGYLNFLVFSNFRVDAQVYAHNLLNHLVSLISVRDSVIVNFIEKIILDETIILKLNNEITNKTGKRTIQKVDLFESYLFNRANIYHSSVEEKIKTMSNSNPNMVDPDLIIDQVAKIFIKDYLGTDYMKNYEFALEFTNNISTNLFTVFSEEVNKLVA